MSNQFINNVSVHMFYKNPNHKFEMKTPQAERAAFLDKTPVQPAKQHTPYSEDRSTWD